MTPRELGEEGTPTPVMTGVPIWPKAVVEGLLRLPMVGPCLPVPNLLRPVGDLGRGWVEHLLRSLAHKLIPGIHDKHPDLAGGDP